MQDQSETETSGGKPAGTPLQEPLSPKMLRCFQDILDVVYTISDEQWKTLVGFVPTVMTKLQFASLCTKIVITISKLAVKIYLPTVIEVLGLDVVLMAEEKLQKKVDHFSMNPSGTSGTASAETSAQRSPVNPADLVCKIIEDFVDEVRMAMQMAISKVASSKASSFPNNWKATCNSVADEMFKILETKMKPSPTEDTTLREDQERSDLDTTAVTEEISTELKQSAGPSDVSQDSKTLVAKLAPSVKPQETSGYSVSLIDDLTLSCTNDVINEILRLCHSDIFHSDSRIPADTKISEPSTASRQRLYAVMQNLEKIIRASRCLSKSSLKGRDLEGSEAVSFPVSATGVEEDDAPGFGALSHHTERLFSADFHVKATQAVRDALLKEISGSVHFIETSNGMTSKSILHTSVEEVDMLESPSATTLPPSALLDLCASQITTAFLKELERTFSSHMDCGRVTEPTSAMNVITAAHRIYRNVHYKVFGFLLRLQEPHSAEDESFQYPATSAEYQESDSDKKQIHQQISDEAIHCHADRLINLTSDVLQTMAGPSRVWRGFSDSLLETSWVRKNLLRHPEQVPPALASVFVEDSVRSLVLHLCLLSHSQASPHSADRSNSPAFSDREVQDTSAGSEAPNASTEKPPGALRQFNKALKNLGMKLLCSTRTTVDVMEDPQASLEKSEQAEINNDIKSTGASPSPTSRAGSEIVRETLENFRLSTEKVDSDSARPLNDFPSGAESVMEKKRGLSFRFIVTKKAPLIRIGYKSPGASPTPASKSGSLTVEDILESLDWESYSSSNSSRSENTFFKKTRQRLSRMFSAIRKILPNPFKRVIQPS